MDSFQALGLCEQGLNFKLQVTFPDKHSEVFEVSARCTVDKIKTIVFANSSHVNGLAIEDYRLGVSEDAQLEVEFMKFIVSHPAIRDALENDNDYVRVGLFRKGSFIRSPMRERVDLNADVNVANLRTSLEQSLQSIKGKKHQRGSSSDLFVQKEKKKDKSEPKLQRRNSLTHLKGEKEDSDEEKKKNHGGSMLTVNINAAHLRRRDNVKSMEFRGVDLGIPPQSGASVLLRPSLSSPRLPDSPPSRSPDSPSGSPKLNATFADLPDVDQLTALVATTAKGYTIEVGSPMCPLNKLDIKDFAIADSVRSEPWYRDFFLGKEHFNFVSADNKDTLIISLVKDELYFNSSTDSGSCSPKDGSNGGFRLIVRTKSRDEKKRVAAPKEGSGLFGSKKKPPVKDMMQDAFPSYNLKKIHMVKDPAISAQLLAFEERQLVNKYKIGVLYCAAGQTDDDEMFGNEHGSADFEEFLSVLGDKIELAGWQNYRAGLDVKNGTTGKQSVYTRFRDYEVMFHVSTLLPFQEADLQRVERKRHLGNDIAVIIFKEGNDPYDPTTIKSEFNHIFVVVSKVKKKNSNKTFYRLSVASKDGVPQFKPDLPLPCVFEKGQLFRELLLHKLINGETASYEAPAFKFKIQRTRMQLLKDLQNNFADS